MVPSSSIQHLRTVTANKQLKFTLMKEPRRPFSWCSRICKAKLLSHGGGEKAMHGQSLPVRYRLGEEKWNNPPSTNIDRTCISSLWVQTAESCSYPRSIIIDLLHGSFWITCWEVVSRKLPYSTTPARASRLKARIQDLNLQLCYNWQLLSLNCRRARTRDSGRWASLAGKRKTWLQTESV